MRVLGGLIALLLWPSIASADVIDVCTTCSYTTIADGLAAAIAGDVVSVDAGTWDGCVTVPPAVSLRGAGDVPEDVVIDGTCST